MAEVLLDLPASLLVGDAGDVIAEHRLAAAAPLTALDLPQTVDQLLDAPGHLLAIGASREA